MKKYLKTIEDIEALRNTDTKIYRDNHRSYFKFVNGVPCIFCETSDVFYNATIDFNQVESKLYIEVEDEPSEDWIGKLGWVSDNDPKDKNRCGLLIEKDNHETRPYHCAVNMRWRYFTPLTPEEVEKYTGYKVVRED